MTKTLASVVLSCVFVTAAAPSAQAAQAKGITALGVKAGASFANIFGEDVFDQKFRLGLALGGFLTYGLSERVALQPELLFVMKGSRYKSTRFGEYKETMSFNYLEVPLLAKYVVSRKPVPVAIFAGPALSLKLGAKVKYEWEGLAEEEDVEGLKGADFGLAIGAGTEYNLSRTGRFTLDLRYTLGLANIDEDGGTVRNGTFLFLVGWTF